MNSGEKVNYIKNVARSCETYEHWDSAYQWFHRVKKGLNYIEKYECETLLNSKLLEISLKS